MAGASLVLFILFFSSSAFGSGAFPLDGAEDIVGMLDYYRVEEKESLLEVAKKFGLGYNEIVEANPGIDPWVPGAGVEVLIPAKWILPDVSEDAHEGQSPPEREGIVINLAEFRLYHFMDAKGGKFLRTYPLGLSREGFETPLGKYIVSQKLENPSWTPPDSIRKEKPELPRVVPPGPENPLGAYAMRLSGTTYLIHGTNRPYGVGRRVSGGCIRLYPDDIKALFGSVRPGTRVSIVYRTVKVGVREGIVHVEVHGDYLGIAGDPFAEAVELLRRRNLFEGVDMDVLRLELKEKRGFPVPVSKGPDVAGPKKK